MPALPVAAAAAELCVSERQLRRWLRDGAPQARRGGRGRGRQTLIDPEAVRAWRRHDELAVFKARLPEQLADALYEAFVFTEGAHKRMTAGAIAGAWYLACAEIVYEPDTEPAKITRLRHIFDGRARVPSSINDFPEDESWT